MDLFIKLAIRNVHRNFRSALLNGLGITLAVVLLLLIFSLSRGIEKQIVGRSIRFDSGALDFTFSKKTASTQNQVQGDSLFREIRHTLESHPGVSGYTCRVYPSNALLYSSEHTQRIHIVGIDTSEIPLLTEMFKILEGNPANLHKGKHIVISSGMAEKFHLKIGDSCPIMLESVDGSINLDDFVVAGIFRYTSLLNKHNVYMSYEEARRLYNCRLPTRILVSLRSLEQVDAVKKDVLSRLKGIADGGADTVSPVGIRLFTYKDHTGFASSLSGINRYGMSGVAFFLVAISFVGIWSMQTENIQKRKKEIGTLFSFGFSKKAMKKIFLFESLYISLLFSIPAVLILTVFLGVIHVRQGIYLGEAASFAFGSAVVDPVLTGKDVWGTLCFSLGYPLVATWFAFGAIPKNRLISMLREE